MPDTLIAPSPLIRKLEALSQRFGEIESQLHDPAVTSNHLKLAALSKERGKLEPIVTQYRAYQRALAQVQELREMMQNKTDIDMADLAAEELPGTEAKAASMLE